MGGKAAATATYSSSVSVALFDLWKFALAVSAACRGHHRKALTLTFILGEKSRQKTSCGQTYARKCEAPSKTASFWPPGQRLVNASTWAKAWGHHLPSRLRAAIGLVYVAMGWRHRRLEHWGGRSNLIKYPPKGGRLILHCSVHL